MITVPLPAEVAARLQIGAGTDNDTIEVVPSPERADYLLMGRIHGNVLEYAWVRPLTTSAQTQMAALPARTDWLPLNDDTPDSLAIGLRQRAQRLAVLRAWLQLESPADTGRFPYHLAIRNTATGETRTSGPTRDGESYDLVLVVDDAMAHQVFDRRFVYVFAIDSAGSSTLLFPAGAAGAVENRLPLAVSDNGELPKEIRLAGFTVAAPFGVDTFMLLTSATQLADPTVLEGEAVRRVESTRGSSDPLTQLLAQQRSTRRGAATMTPPTWSLERLSIVSVPGKSDK